MPILWGHFTLTSKSTQISQIFLSNSSKSKTNESKKWFTPILEFNILHHLENAKVLVWGSAYSIILIKM